MNRIIVLVLLLLLTITLTISLSSPPSIIRIKVQKNIIASITIALSILGTNPSITYASDNKSIGDIEVSMENKKVKVSEYLGKKGTLIVNVASQCALTNQYEGLVDLYNEYHDQGLNIIGFPCNQFGNQEPDASEKVRVNMKKQFNVDFPLFDKIDVNGPFESPLYTELKSYSDIGMNPKSNTKKVSWNFQKYLISSDGRPLRMYKPGVVPEVIRSDIDSLIKTNKIPPVKKTQLNDY